MKKKLLKNKLIRNKRKKNKIFLGIFLLIVFFTISLKAIDSILLDLGFYKGEFHFRFWNDPKFILEAKTNKDMADMIKKHPNFFWPLTQFTWITTILITLMMIFRYFNYNQKSLPNWLKWIMTQRTISLIVMYDIIVCLIFWSAIFNGVVETFTPDLWQIELIYTIFVHAIIPLLMSIYSIIYLIKDKRASILKEGFVFKGMIYPVFYIGYYILISMIWEDPYPITNIHNDLMGKIILIPVVLFTFYVFLGFMIIFHNLILLKLNKTYDPKKDFEILNRKNDKIQKIKKKEFEKINKNNYSSQK